MADVKRAYLDYYAALGSAYTELSVTPLQPFETAAGLQEEDHTMASFRQTGYHYSLTADHDLQVVIYSGGDSPGLQPGDPGRCGERNPSGEGPGATPL